MSETARVSYEMSGPTAKRIKNRASKSEIKERKAKVIEYLRAHQGEALTLDRVAEYSGYKTAPNIYSYIMSLIKKGKLYRFENGIGKNGKPIYSYQIGDGKAPSEVKVRQGSREDIGKAKQNQIRISRVERLAQQFIYEKATTENLDYFRGVKEFVEELRGNENE